MDGVYPLVNCPIAIENDPVEIVDLPIKNLVIFHSYVSLPEGNGKIRKNKMDDSRVFPLFFMETLWKPYGNLMETSKW